MTMKAIGRIVLLIAAGLLIGFSVANFINSIQGLIACNWSFATDAEKAIWTTFFSTGVQVLLGVYAIFYAIFPRKSFIMFLAIIILFVPPVMMIVTDVRAGNLTGFDWGVFQKYGPSFSAPILYLFGAILCVVGNAKEI